MKFSVTLTLETRERNFLSALFRFVFISLKTLDFVAIKFSVILTPGTREGNLLLALLTDLFNSFYRGTLSFSVMSAGTEFKLYFDFAVVTETLRVIC